MVLDGDGETGRHYVNHTSYKNILLITPHTLDYSKKSTLFFHHLQTQACRRIFHHDAVDCFTAAASRAEYTSCAAARTVSCCEAEAYDPPIPRKKGVDNLDLTAVCPPCLTNPTLFGIPRRALPLQTLNLGRPTLRIDQQQP